MQNNQGINLQKGSVVALRKVNGDKLSTICIGLNWGAIESNMFFGLIPTKESVDLDSSVAIFDKSKMLVDQVYYGKLTSHVFAIRDICPGKAAPKECRSQISALPAIAARVRLQSQKQRGHSQRFSRAIHICTRSFSARPTTWATMEMPLQVFSIMEVFCI